MKKTEPLRTIDLQVEENFYRLEEHMQGTRTFYRVSLLKDASRHAWMHWIDGKWSLSQANAAPHFQAAEPLLRAVILDSRVGMN